MLRLSWTSFQCAECPRVCLWLMPWTAQHWVLGGCHHHVWGFGNSTSSSTLRLLILASYIHAKQSKHSDSLWESGILKLLILRQWKTFISVQVLPIIFIHLSTWSFTYLPRKFLRLTIDKSQHSSPRRNCFTVLTDVFVDIM